MATALNRNRVAKSFSGENNERLTIGKLLDGNKNDSKKKK